jgi:propanediol dehydratase small subunit
MGVLGAIGLVILLSLFWMKFGAILPEKYRLRKCQGAQWRRAFPHATKDDIRSFLLLFTFAFAFRDSEKLKFSPNDGVWEIYRNLYPNRWIPDGLELETLTSEIGTKHAVALRDIWSEKLTLGEIFEYVQRSRV